MFMMTTNPLSCVIKKKRANMNVGCGSTRRDRCVNNAASLTTAAPVTR